MAIMNVLGAMVFDAVGRRQLGEEFEFHIKLKSG